MSRHKTRQINRIIEATIALIDSEGLSQVNMSKIATATGVTRQTVYNYFPDVESIVASAIDAHSSAVEAHLLEVMDAASGVQEKLRALAEFQVSIAASGHSNIGLEAGLSADLRRKLAAHTNPVKKVLADLIDAAQQNGELSAKPDPAVASVLVWELIDSAATVAAKYPDQKTFLTDAVNRAVWAALRD